MIKRLYPSSSAFMWHETVITEYDSGCLRSILLSAHGAKTAFPAIYQKVGAAHEEWYEETVLKTDPRIITYSREVPIKQAIEGVDGVIYSGRMDVLSAYAVGGAVIHETKGTISKNSRLNVIRKGKVKLNQLAQLVSYMIAKEITKGKLVVGYYEEDHEGNLRHQEGRDFKVEINDEGLILVDGEPSGYTVQDQIRHRIAAAKVLASNTVGARPDKWDQKWGGPCSNCHFATVCDNFDRGELNGTDEFIEAGRSAARDYVPGPEPEPFKIRAPKAPKPIKAKRARRGSKSNEPT